MHSSISPLSNMTKLSPSCTHRITTCNNKHLNRLENTDQRVTQTNTFLIKSVINTELFYLKPDILSSAVYAQKLLPCYLNPGLWPDHWLHIGNYTLCYETDVYFLGYWTFSTHHFCDSYKLPHILLSWYSPHKLSVILSCSQPRVCASSLSCHITWKPVFTSATMQYRWPVTQCIANQYSIKWNNNTMPSCTACPTPLTTNITVLL